MRGILADVNAEGQLSRLVGVLLQSDTWSQLWADFDLDIESFRSLGFDRQMPDDELWRACQGDGLVLVTGNRNKDGPTSLEAVIGAENTPTSLPVITVANLKRVTTDRAYAEATALRLLERLIDMPLLLGAGRLYIP